ncbi:hypothetical protein C8J57DRAFT_1361490 [Mycena rebaudengoi]|nr:hypothetical protein C8J57DRAFT_1361490 [Mycena rebaudengoi]
MDNSLSEAARLNNEARKLFNERKFREAANLYQAASKADTLKSPVYLSNLALVQLKLEKFAMAEITATMALMNDARFHKARYRRALARQKQGRLAEALVDLAGVLTADPMDKVAAAAFATVSYEHEKLGDGRGFLTTAAILRADYPSAYGSAIVPRRFPPPVRRTSPEGAATGIEIPDDKSHISKSLKGGPCAWCKAVKWRRELKTCRACGTAVYCDEVCQRNAWPMHKKECIPYDDDYALSIHISRNLLDHKFINMQILIYAMRSIGALHHPTPPYLAVLLVFVKMVPLTIGTSARRRLSITNIVTAPLAVFDSGAQNSYVSQLQQTRETCNTPNALGVAIFVAPQPMSQKTDKCRTLIFMQRLMPEMVALANQTVFPIGFESHSFGISPKITSDLDELYWLLEDELANDLENYYGLQR